MVGLWKNLKLQAKFALVIGAGILALAALTVAVIGYLEYAGIEQRLRTFSERELSSLNAMVDSTMRMRLDDPQNVAIKVFYGWFDSRNKEYDGKLWSVWGPKMAAYVARTAPNQPAKAAVDAIDEEALRTGQPVGRFVGDTYRYSIPIVWGVSVVTKQEVCVGCHASAMGQKDGEVLGVFSSSVSTTKDFALLRQHILLTSAGALVGILALLLAIWLIFGRVVARPIRNLINVLGQIDGGNTKVEIEGTGRGDEIGSLAKAVVVIRAARDADMANTRIRTALDVVRSNVMLSDENYNIIYINETLQQMLREAEAELRKVLPGFDSSKLIGAKMDIFHRNAAHQRKILDGLNGTHEARITVGTQEFHLFATAVVDKDNKRAGTVVEWRNETAEKAIEEEINGIVKAAIAGDFSKRVPTEGKKEFMLNLATAMNSLCENVARALGDLLRMLSALAEGDLTPRITAEYQGAFATLRNDANAMADRLGATIADIKASAREVTNAAAEISTSTTDLSQRTEEQAASLEETSASMEQIAATVKKNAENAQAANQSAGGTRAVADRGGQVVAKAVDAMAKIEQSSRKISDIIGVIDEIARQTNLLALNAAVEAARAGEAGRGFAVVASEVRSLAQRSSQAAKDIKDLITNSNDQVKDGVDLVNKAGSALTEIVDSIKKVANIVSDIAAASAEQSTGIEQVNKALAQMDEVTQQNSALVEQNAATAKTLEQQAKGMDERVGFFRIHDAAAAEPAMQPGASQGQRAAVAAAKPQLTMQPKQQPAASNGVAARRVAASGGPVGRMQAAVAAAIKNDADWQEF